MSMTRLVFQEALESKGLMIMIRNLMLKIIPIEEIISTVLMLAVGR